MNLTIMPRFSVQPQQVNRQMNTNQTKYSRQDIEFGIKLKIVPVVENVQYP